MAGGVAFNKQIMDAAAQVLEDRTTSELYKIYSDLKDRIETEVGRDGTKWNGQKASEFHDHFVTKQKPEFEKMHDNIRNIAKNIRNQAQAWQDFDEQ